ncbi:MAG: phosphonate ABC transporter ATP-binding protein [Armatimonadota bacterium]|nr:phosphonate ABC transporter ATP-binding protein [Armatimonadota bacterium]
MSLDTHPDTVVSVQGLSHSYRRGQPVLRGLDLPIRKGEMVAVIGLSGAGKSTLLRCINGLVTPSEGSVEVFGQDVAKLHERDRVQLRRRIGMIFQEFNLVDRLSALKNVLVGRLGYTATIPSCLHLFKKEDVAFARECLAKVGLEEYETRRVRDLSGGQKQRVAIARSMAQQAELILADEATANLDVLTKAEIMDLLQALTREQGVTMLFSMHDLPLARAYCSRIIGLKDGQITFDAPPDRLDEAAVADILGRMPVG